MEQVLIVAPLLIVVAMLVAIQTFGATVIEWARNPEYRAAAVRAVEALGSQVERGSRRDRRAMKVRGFLHVLALAARFGLGGTRRRSILGNEVGALTLAESAKLSENDLQRGVVETFVIESSVLDRLPLLNINGNAYAYNEETTLPGIEFRAVNSAYAESTGTVTPRTESLVILGGDADVDTFIVQTRGNLNDQRAIQTRGKVKAAVYKFQDTFINGDTAVDANAFDGLKKRLTGAQVIAAGANGTGPISGGHNFFDSLDALIAAVAGGPDALYMNSAILGKIRSSARRLGGWNMERDEFGRAIDFYNSVPMLDIGKKADGTEIIPQSEVQGTSVDASSIYAVKFGRGEADQAVSGLTNGGIQVKDLGELDSKPVYRTRIEFFCGLGVFGGKAAARLTGVLNS